MAGIYNPYQEGPDMAGFTQQMMGQIMQMMMLKKMFAEKGVPESQGGAQLGGPGGSIGGMMGQGQPQMGPPQMGQPPPGPPQMGGPMPQMDLSQQPSTGMTGGFGLDMQPQSMGGIDPQLMQMLMSILGQPSQGTNYR